MYTEDDMTTSCKYCGRTHPVGHVCSKKPVRPRYDQDWNEKHRGDPERRFRSSHAWREKAEQIRKRDYHLCRVCLDGEYGCQVPGRLQVHHIVPLTQGWDSRLDDDNLITLCSMHHRDAEEGKIPAGYLRGLASTPPVFDKKSGGA